jgi:gas vesicle protein
MAGKFLTGVIAAAGGAALGVLLAPDKGTETRKKITTKRDEYLDRLDEQFEKLQDGVHDRLEKFLETLNESTQRTGRRSQEGRSQTNMGTQDVNRQGDTYTPSEGDEQFTGSSGPAL